MRRPNFILSIIGMLILAMGIFTCSVVYWLVSNIIFIVAGMGVLFIFVIFLSGIYSYVKDMKVIQKNFDGERGDELIISLRKKTFATAQKLIVMMLLYGLSWGIIICILQHWLL